MTALGKLLRTTAFKLTLVYLVVFAMFAAFLLGYFAWNTRRLVTEQITETVDAEIRASPTSTATAASGGWCSRSTHARGGRDRAFISSPRSAGEGLAGNVGSLAAGVLEHAGWSETAYRRIEDVEGNEHHALARVIQLPGGFRLLVGRDLDERERLFAIVAAAGRWSLAIVVVLGLAGGFFVSRRVLKRIDAMSDTTQTIMRAISADGSDRRHRATNSTASPPTSTPCSTASRR